MVMSLLAVIVCVLGIVALVPIVDGLEEDGLVGFLVPYKAYLSSGVILLLGYLGVQAFCSWASAYGKRHMPTDIAHTIPTITFLVKVGLVGALVVYVITDSATVAVSLAGVTGLVAGFALQSVVGNLLAGVFIALTRPIDIGGEVTIAGHKGKVKGITIRYIVLTADGEEVLIPSSTVVNGVLVKHDPHEGGE